MEIWKDIPSYEGIYQISNLGRVKSIGRKVPWKNGFRTIRGRILKNGKNEDGYYNVKLCDNGKNKTMMVHQLVCIAFLNHTPNGNIMVCNHKNHIKTDNRLDNLEVVTHRYNTGYRNIKYTSKYVGVSWARNIKKWASKIRINGKLKHLGTFKHEFEAFMAYEKAKRQLIINT